ANRRIWRVGGASRRPGEPRGGRMGHVHTIDWETLQSSAFEMVRRSYAPYSGYPVGAAAVTIDGRTVTGCNVENVSSGLTLCAETVLVGNLFALGGGRLRAVAVVDAAGRPIAPCGRCRQVLYEHRGPELLVAGPDGPWTMADLLPHPFGPEDLGRHGRPVTTGPQRLTGPPARLPEGHRALKSGDTGVVDSGDDGEPGGAGPRR